MRGNRRIELKRGLLLGCLGAILTAGVGCDLLAALQYRDDGGDGIARLRSVEEAEPFAGREKVRERSRIRCIMK